MTLLNIPPLLKIKNNKQQTTIPILNKFLKYFRLLRKDIHSFEGCITLFQLSKLLQKYGIGLSDRNKQMISQLYSLPPDKAAKILPVYTINNKRIYTIKISSILFIYLFIYLQITSTYFL